MQHPDQVALAVAEHRQAHVVRRRQLPHYVIEVLFERDRLDLRARQHDVLHRDAAEVKEVHEDRAVLLGHELPRLEHQRADLVGRQLLRLVALGRVDAHEREQARHEQVHEPHHRREELEQRSQHVGERQRDALGVGCANHLRRDLGEHEDQERDQQRADAERDLVFAEELDRDDRHQGRRSRVDEVVAEQDHAEQSMGLPQQDGGALCAAVALADEVLQPVTVQRHHARFGNREEGRDHEQHAERAELPA